MNYKETVFLPRTEFPMRGGLPKKEPEILAGWKQIDIYRKLRETRKDAESFVLHDGPPQGTGSPLRPAAREGREGRAGGPLRLREQRCHWLRGAMLLAPAHELLLMRALHHHASTRF